MQGIQVKGCASISFNEQILIFELILIKIIALEFYLRKNVKGINILN